MIAIYSDDAGVTAAAAAVAVAAAVTIGRCGDLWGVFRLSSKWQESSDGQQKEEIRMEGIADSKWAEGHWWQRRSTSQR